jgi:FkbM family methyltransferase
MKKIFLDVGGHDGQTLEEVVSDKYKFDLIYCFEPMKEQYEHLLARFGEMEMSAELIILNTGLADQNTKMNVYGNNVDMGASIYQQKDDLAGREVVSECDFIRTSDFFSEKIEEADTVVMKLNCEGSECMILNDLLDSGQIWKIDNVMIDFDVRKIPDMKSEETKLLDRFRKENFTNFSLCESVMVGKTHQKRIHNWLASLAFHDTFMEASHPFQSFVKRLFGS